MKKLSIVIPAFNAEKYIINTLVSMVNQPVDFNNIELIVVNDGSSDKTLESVEQFSKGVPSITLNIYSKENGGLGSARNFGIEKAKGDYIWFFDADDIMEKGSLSKVMSKLNDDLDLLGFGVKETYVKTNKIKVVNVKNRPINVVVNGRNYIENYDIGHSACCFIVKKSILIENSIYFLEDVLSEDFDFELRLFEKCKNITHIDAICYNYIIREGSLSRRKNSEYYTFHHRSMIKIIDNLNLNFRKSKDLDYKKSVEIYITRIKIIALINLLKSTLPKDKVNLFFQQFKQGGFLELADYRKSKLGWKHYIVFTLVNFNLIELFLFFKK